MDWGVQFLTSRGHFSPVNLGKREFYRDLEAVKGKQGRIASQLENKERLFGLD